MSNITQSERIEISSELADDLLNRYHSNIKIYADSSDGVTAYTNEAQEIFNGLYDIISNEIESVLNVEGQNKSLFHK